MKMKYLEKIAERYFDTWTNDGIDDFHADVQEITAWLKRTDLYAEADADLADLTDEEIDKVAGMISEMVKTAEVPAPATLQELTGQESGIVIYDNGEMIICNWCQFGDYELPKVFSGISVMGWDEGEDIFDGAKEEYVPDYRYLLDGKDLIWDQCDDIKHIADPDTDPAWFRANLYTLTDGTIIIAPKMWN